MFGRSRAPVVVDLLLRIFTVAVAALMAAGCAAHSTTLVRPGQQATGQAPEGVSMSGVSPPAPAAPLPATVSAPVWKRAYEWSYRYESPTDKGTYVWSVDREEVSDGVECYVIKTGTREIFYRKSDFAHVRETVDGALVIRDVPPSVNYTWPLVVGKTWEQSCQEERPQARQTEDFARTVSWTPKRPSPFPPEPSRHSRSVGAANGAPPQSTRCGTRRR